MLQHGNSFNGDYDNNHSVNLFHYQITGIENMLLIGVNIVANEIVTQLLLTISQLICFNGRKETKLRHQTGRAIPLSDFMGLLVFGKQKREK